MIFVHFLSTEWFLSRVLMTEWFLTTRVSANHCVTMVTKRICACHEAFYPGYLWFPVSWLTTISPRPATVRCKCNEGCHKFVLARTGPSRSNGRRWTTTTWRKGTLTRWLFDKLSAKYLRIHEVCVQTLIQLLQQWTGGMNYRLKVLEQQLVSGELYAIVFWFAMLFTSATVSTS